VSGSADGGSVELIVNLPHGRPGAGCALRAAGLLTAGAAFVLVVGVAGCRPDTSPGADGSPDATPATPGGTEETTAAGSPERPRSTSPRTTYTLVQMNLCLSGLAGCYEDTAYPAVVDDAVTRIRELRPDAVTVTEACRRDARRIAAQAGYHLRFARVIYAGTRLPCVDPGGRGVFGDAVLTRAPIVGFETEPFTAQSDLEERRWLCATTRPAVDVCTAHLETPHTRAAAEARDAQCTELAEVLADRRSRAFVFGGDVNRLGPCAPPDAWQRSDLGADSAPGIQHAYGSANLRDPTAEVVAAPFSDHDLLVVRAQAPR
jgi:hypothetical protein